jgi:hypothetical protein
MARTNCMSWMGGTQRHVHAPSAFTSSAHGVIQVMSNQPDGSYASRDLFVKHPTIPDAYKFIGRIDDTLVMVWLTPFTPNLPAKG